MVFKCSACHNKQQQLRRIYGTWPSDEFQQLSEAAQQEFMASSAELTGVDLVKTLEAQVQQEVSRTDAWSEGGEFQPLSVWAARGYKTEDITNNATPADIMKHPMFGVVYRVSVVYKGKHLASTSSKKHVQQLRKAASTARERAPEPEVRSEAQQPERAIAKVQPPNDSSSSSSETSSSSASSSDSSDDAKKKKKHKKDKHSKKHKKKSKHSKKEKKGKKDKSGKKDKKDKKAAVVLETPAAKRARLQAEEKNRTMNKKWATIVVSKLSALVATMECASNHPSFDTVPLDLSEPFEKSFADLKKKLSLASDVLATNGDGDAGVSDMTALNLQVSAAKKSLSSVERILRRA